MSMSTHRIQPIPVLNLCDRYYIHLDKAIVYDMNTDSEVQPFLHEGKMHVTLRTTDNNDEVILAVSDILLTTLYGYTGCRPSIEITQYPVNTEEIYPRYSEFYDTADGYVTVNGILYKQWRDTPYYVSKDGAVFSLQKYGFSRRYYNEKGYIKVSLFKMKHSLHRVLWEAYKGIIPGSMEIDHIDDRRWHTVLSNLQLLTHKSNLDKIDINKRGGKGQGRFNIDTICKIGTALLNYERIEDIAEKYKVPKYRIAAIKYQGLYKDILEDNGIDLSNIQRQSKFRSLSPEIIRQIRSLHAEGLSQTQIAKDFGYTRQMVNYIVNNKTWKVIAD